MTIRFLPEYADNARHSLEMAERAAAHLKYSRASLFAQAIDLEWVESLKEKEELSEKIDAFVGRFGRLQDYIGEKPLPRFAALSGEQTKSLLDNLAYAEKMGWVNAAESFVAARKLRNLLVHEYMTHAALFLESLQAANKATDMLIEIVEKVRRYGGEIGAL